MLVSGRVTTVPTLKPTACTGRDKIQSHPFLRAICLFQGGFFIMGIYPDAFEIRVGKNKVHLILLISTSQMGL